MAILIGVKNDSSDQETVVDQTEVVKIMFLYTSLTMK